MENSDLMTQFERLDADGSGFLSVVELLAQMPAGSREKAQTVLDMMDGDADGRVSYKEFVGFYFGGFEPAEVTRWSEDSVELEPTNDPDDTNNDGLIDSYEALTSDKLYESSDNN